MKIFKSNIINYFDLSEKWQAEAKSNLGDMAEEASYIEPDDSHVPEKHALKDLTEAMTSQGEHNGFCYNAYIGISNNSCMLLNFSDDMETVEYIYI